MPRAIGPREASPGEIDALDIFVGEFFDAPSYLELYPDVEEQSRREVNFAASRHFREHGRTEGRSPSLLFDIPYVVQRFARVDGIEVAQGAAVDRFCALSRERRFVPNRWFSPWAFRRLYDRSHALLCACSDYEAFEFYLFYGSELHLSPNGLFSEEGYLARYPDVALALAAGGQRSGFLHFVVAGYYDARHNMPGFGMPGLGVAEGPAPIEERAFLLRHRSDMQRVLNWFDETFYLTVYDDVHVLKRSGTIRSGLEHYMVAGFAEGRIPSPAAWRAIERARASGIDDPWALAAHLAAIPPCPAKVDLPEATRILACIAPSPERRNLVQAALWLHVARPAIGGKLDPRAYLAINTDVAAMFGDDDVDRATHHWHEHGVFENRAATGSNLFADRSITLAGVADWKSGVNYFGPLSASSGLGEAARGYLAALRSAGIPVAAYDVSALFRADLPCDLVAADDLPYAINFFLLNADQVVPFTQRYGTAIFDGRANVGAWVWELPAPRIEWRAALSAFDLIIVPSAFCASSFASATSRPIEVVPYVVSADLLHRNAARPTASPPVLAVEAAKTAGRRIVLFVMDASSYVQRKGLDLYIALARRVEAARPGTCLFVMKSHSRDVSGADSLPPEGSFFQVIDELLDFPSLCRLRALADAYVSPHRSEGFGLNIFESIMLGVPTVASAFAGGIDRLGADYPYLVSGRLSEIGRDLGPYLADAIWFEPDPAALEAALYAALDTGRDARLDAIAGRLADALSVASVGAALKAQLQRHCALDAEGQPDIIARFTPLTRIAKDECFVLGHVDDATRRSPHAPGRARLGELIMASRKPFFSVITPAWNTEPHWLDELYDDLLQQGFCAWEWCIADDASTRPDTRAALDALRRRDSRVKIVRLAANAGIAGATNAAVTMSCGRYLVMVDHDDRIAPDLLAAYHARILASGETAELLYCDEDKIDDRGNHSEHYYKPDWSPEHIISCMYVLHCLAIRKSRFLALGGYDAAFDGAQDYEFVLRAADAGTPIAHVDRLLYHWRISAGSAAGATIAKSDGIAAGRRALEAHCERLRIPALVEHGAIAGTYRVRPALPRDRVTLLVLTGLTRDQSDPARRSYAEGFVRSILEHAPSIDFEIHVVVDAQIAEEAGHLAALDSRVLIMPYSWAGTSFNFAHKANWAVRNAGTDRVVLLNDDMQATDKDWLPALLEMLEMPGVGVVGGRLLYRDDRIQHSGIVMGVHGACTHLFAGMEPAHRSYNLFAHVIRNYSAVTGAMLAFRRTLFERVRGFDEAYPIDYNDIDFCLRVQEAGLRIVYTPHAELKHFESRSAVRMSADDLDTDRFSHRWSRHIAHDPYYNSNLTRHGVMCELAAIAGNA